MPNIYKTPQGRALVEERYHRFLNFWPQPNRQFHVPTSQGDTFVIASGDESAPPLLLLHGSTGNSVTWIADAPQWSTSFRVFAIDVIGEPGLSAPSRPPLTSDAYASWLDEVRVELGLDRVSLVGVSLGGWLALDYATRHPENVEGLALISPAGIGRQKLGILLKFAFMKLLGPWGTYKLRAFHR